MSYGRACNYQENFWELHALPRATPSLLLQQHNKSLNHDLSSNYGINREGRTNRKKSNYYHAYA